MRTEPAHRPLVERVAELEQRIADMAEYLDTLTGQLERVKAEVFE